jgi:hypothetical protein
MVLEEVQMSPGLLHGVVHRAVGLTAVGARKFDLDIDRLPSASTSAADTIQGEARPRAN